MGRSFQHKTPSRTSSSDLQARQNACFYVSASSDDSSFTGSKELFWKRDEMLNECMRKSYLVVKLTPMVFSGRVSARAECQGAQTNPANKNGKVNKAYFEVWLTIQKARLLRISMKGAKNECFLKQETTLGWYFRCNHNQGTLPKIIGDRNTTDPQKFSHFSIVEKTIRVVCQFWISVTHLIRPNRNFWLDTAPSYLKQNEKEFRDGLWRCYQKSSYIMTAAKRTLVSL